VLVLENEHDHDHDYEYHSAGLCAGLIRAERILTERVSGHCVGARARAAAHPLEIASPAASSIVGGVAKLLKLE
jgi:hypothetical protein